MSNTSNNIELLVKLGIDKTNTSDLQTQVDTLGSKLAGLKVDIKIDPKAIAALEKISTMDFSKLAGNAKKATDQVSGLTVKSAKEIEEAIKKAQESLGMNFSKTVKEKAFTSIDAIKKEFKRFNPDIKVNFDVKDGVKEINKIMATVQKDGKKHNIEFGQVLVGNEAAWMPKSITELDNASTKVAKNISELTAKLNKLRLEGKITDDQFKSFSIGKNADFGNLDRQLDSIVINNKKATEAIRAQEKAQRDQVAELKRQEEAQKRIVENDIKRKNLILDIERAMKSQSRTLDSGAARTLIEQTRALDTSSKNFGTSLKQNQSALRELRTNATEATRQNIGLVEAMRTAFTKFPIWMAASTAFFGTIRTAKEFGSIIVDIDTKMTNLAKVMSDDTDFEAVFNRATASAERFGQSISSALDAYAEFARQGYKEDELGILADAGLVASNVGEITAQKASEYMTASLIQWKKDASEAMSIVDSWNEISNNYATTTEKLAQGQARAGATARAMGLDFDNNLLK